MEMKLIEALRAEIREVTREEILALKDELNLQEQDSGVMDFKHKLNEIMAKPFLRVTEAAFLLSCSESHVRNQIKLAKKKKTSNPIPFTDHLGIILFNREKLLSWMDSKQNLKPVESEKISCPTATHNLHLTQSNFPDRARKEHE